MSELLARGMEELVGVVQELSLARTLEDVQRIVRTAARALTGADGATFVLRDGDSCFYADEDAIAPLWKGKRFPLASCVSGWVMNNAQPAIIPDIYSDPRVPIDAYRPTFVKSLAMVPIRTLAPIGAIGNYWAEPHLPTIDEVKLLRALADSTSIAIENVRVYSELEQRVQQRTMELERANRELETFSYSVSHDLRAPVRAIDGFCELLLEDTGDALGEQGRAYLARIGASTARMSQLIDDLLALAHVSRTELHRARIDLSDVAREIAERHARSAPARVEVTIDPTPAAHADRGLAGIVLENLISNAVKYSRKREAPRVRFGAEVVDGQQVYFLQDNGAGFDMSRVGELFAPFRRLHTAAEFEGTGVGLATVHRIVERHGGRIWAESTPDQGATFRFSFG